MLALPMVHDVLGLVNQLAERRPAALARVAEVARWVAKPAGVLVAFCAPRPRLLAQTIRVGRLALLLTVLLRGHLRRLSP